MYTQISACARSYVQTFNILGMYIERDSGGGSSSECGEEGTEKPQSDTHLGFFESVPDDKETLKGPPVRLHFKGATNSPQA